MNRNAYEDGRGTTTEAPAISSVEHGYIVFCFNEDETYNVVKDEGRVSKKTSPRESSCKDEEITEESGSMEILSQLGSRKESFSFPVLQREWIGSPVYMPKSERKVWRRKIKTLSKRLHQCFKS